MNTAHLPFPSRPVVRVRHANRLFHHRQPDLRPGVRLREVRFEAVPQTLEARRRAQLARRAVQKRVKERLPQLRLPVPTQRLRRRVRARRRVFRNLHVLAKQERVNRRRDAVRVRLKRPRLAVHHLDATESFRPVVAEEHRVRWKRVQVERTTKVDQREAFVFPRPRPVRGPVAPLLAAVSNEEIIRLDVCV
eukprot:31257-Pelagococcus_subviridis.AAC.7